jgi:methyltransferase (TIGR00027 family)
MNKNNRIASKNNPLAAIIFYIITVLFLPITVLGYVYYIVYAFIPKKGSQGVSTTAQGPLSARWMQHLLGVRKDEAAKRLMDAMPGTPPLGLYLVLGSTLLAHRLTGFVPKTFRYPFEGEVAAAVQAAARQTFYDMVVDRYLENIQQFVILGAGFDTRAYRLLKDRQVRSFEVDTPKTQAVKRELLKKTGIDETGVTFVSADFEKQDWLTRLTETGFDTGKPALFIWEGVIPYLEREAVEDTFRKIASTAKGSTVAFDYFTTEPLESQSLYWRYGRTTVKAAGEPWKFGVDSTPPTRERLVELIQPNGLSLVEQQTLGQETQGQRAWGGFAIAVVK